MSGKGCDPTYHDRQAHLHPFPDMAFYGIPWVEDFRDPWTDRFYYQQMARIRLTVMADPWLEKKVLKAANRITVVSLGFGELLNDKIFCADKTGIIFNGYDNDDFINVQKNRLGDSIQISHIGTLSISKNPSVLFHALTRLKRKQRGSEFRLNFIGSIHPDILVELETLGLQNITKYYGQLPHSEAIRIMMNSHYLLTVIPNTRKNKGIIPGKIFEYIRSKVPIILIGAPEDDAANIIRETNSGFVFDHEDQAGLFDFLNSLPKTEPLEFEQYDRRNLTENLSNIFNTIS